MTAEILGLLQNSDVYIHHEFLASVSIDDHLPYACLHTNMSNSRASTDLRQNKDFKKLCIVIKYRPQATPSLQLMTS